LKAHCLTDNQGNAQASERYDYRSLDERHQMLGHVQGTIFSPRLTTRDRSMMTESSCAKPTF